MKAVFATLDILKMGLPVPEMTISFSNPGICLKQDIPHAYNPPSSTPDVLTIYGEATIKIIYRTFYSNYVIVANGFDEKNIYEEFFSYLAQDEKELFEAVRDVPQKIDEYFEGKKYPEIKGLF
jgi:hypothetical protein